MQRRHFCGAAAWPWATAAATAAPPAALATGYRADSFHALNLVRYAAAVRAAGGPAIELHPDNRLVRLADIPAAVGEGRVPLGEAILSGMAAQLPVAVADALPFVVQGYDDAWRLWRHQRPLLAEGFEPLGLVLLFAVPWPPQGLYSRKPVQQSADLRGLKMRTYNPTTERLAQLLGCEPVAVPMVDVAAALQAGRIDCMITSALTGVENRVWKQLGWFCDINAWIPKNAVFANRRWFDALPPAQRQALLNAAPAAEQAGWQASRVAADAAKATLRGQGMRVEHASAVLQGELKRLGERFSIEWLRSTGPLANRLFVPFFSER
jgi:TRAP-type transport system periplasmic protein